MRHVIRQSLDGDFGCVNCGEEHGSIVNFTIGCSEAKPATQEPREWQAETGLWDRLRADLNNLGAAYGPITEGVGEAVSECQPKRTYPFTATVTYGGPGDFLTADWGAGDGGSEIVTGSVDNLSPTDRNAYFDGIILAARKKREAQYGILAASEACNIHCGKDDCRKKGCRRKRDQDTGRPHILSAAMSRPLDWEPRVGHKGVEIG